MKPISVHVAEQPYRQLKSIAAHERRPIAELIREAMGEYVARRKRSGPSLREIPAHASGRLRKGWTRDELLDEMRGRTS